MDNNQKNSNNLTFKFGSVVFCLVLILLIINISFAWYTAKVNQGNIDLVSEGIVVSLNTGHDTTLTPDVLKEGVLNDTQTLPNDYDSRKAYYVESFGTTVTVKEYIELYLETSDVNISASIKYLDKTGKAVELTASEIEKYFNVNISFVDSESQTVLVENLVTGSYVMTITISYKLPDELLPVELVNSSLIVLTVTGTLQ